MIPIVDDDVAVCESAVLSLEMDGFQAMFCTGFATAREVLGKASLVFLEITLPGVPGTQALEKFRKNLTDLPVVSG